MEKNYFFKILVALFITMNVMAQNVPNYLPTNGLVGWWPFNGDAIDESGNGHDGIVSDATLSNDRFGNSDKSYNFNGTSSYISCQKPDYGITNVFSISFWVKINKNTSSSAQYLISKGVDGQNGLNLNYNNDNIFYGGLGIGIQNVVLSNSSSIVSVNNWNNYIFIHDGTSIKMYINNVYCGSKLNSNKIDKNSLLMFGKHVLSSYPYFTNGNLDDIAMYNRALTEQEITALYTSAPPCTNPTATITPQGNTTFCQGGFVNLNAATGANYTYEWYNNGQLINGVTASVYQASTSGNYTVKVIDGACNATSTATTVTVNQYPSSGVNVTGNTTFCEGNSVTLIAQGIGTYLWSNGETTQSITVNQTGNYGVAITSNDCVSNSNMTTVTVNPNPTATIIPQGNTTFCQGGFVNLVASGGNSYQWNTGSSAASFSATQSGTYTVNVFNSFGCKASAFQQVTVNPLPDVTLSALNQFTLKNASPIQLVASPLGGTFSGDGVQGSMFSPANVSLGKKTITYSYTSPQGCYGKSSINTFVVDSIGNVCNVTKYDTLKVINTITKYDTIKVNKTIYDTLKVTKTVYDTVKFSKTITDTISILKVKFKLTTGIKANQYTTMNVYPNPTSDVIIIDASDVAALNGYRYKLFDVQGKEVYNALVTNTKTDISMKTFGKAGVYILHVVDANNISIETKQIVLE